MIYQSNKTNSKCHNDHPDDCLKHSFSCPGRIPASVPDNLFGSPFECPKRIPTPRFSSPNSPLSPEELEHLQACIEEINELLRTFGNPRDPDNLTAFRLRFRKLRGIMARLVIACGSCPEELVGCLQDAGRDFLQLYTVGQKKFIPFNRICSIHRCDENQIIEHEQELIDIPLSLRRELVLHFGEVVSASPFLINIFFGLPLHLLLLSFLGCTVKVKLEDETKIVKGVLVGSEEGHLQLQNDKNQIKQINFIKICFISI